MNPLPPLSLQALPTDIHERIVNELAKEAAPATAFVPSIRSWSGTCRQFRQTMSNAGWLSAENVCKYKFERALAFTCPALRILNVAERHAEALTLSVFTEALLSLPYIENRPEDAILTVMLLQRAGPRLRPELRLALQASTKAARFEFPDETDAQGWTVSEDAFMQLGWFIDASLGIHRLGTTHEDSLIYFFVDDCFAVLQRLSVGLKSLAFMMVADRISYMAPSHFLSVQDDRLDLLFDLESLMPVQWDPALLNLYYNNQDFSEQLNDLLKYGQASSGTVAGLCCRVLRLVGNFLDGLPDPDAGRTLSSPGVGQRHWKRLMAGQNAEQVNFIKRLLCLVARHLNDKRIRRAYLETLVGRGFIHRAECPFGSDRLGRQKDFDGWCTHADGTPAIDSESEPESASTPWASSVESGT